ncbi:MAG: hypothetical protein QME81_08610 [bacterium]|nr:hypothetical protein [bacterium]
MIDCKRLSSNISLHPIDLHKVKRYPLKQRKNKVKIADFGRPCSAGEGFGSFLDSLPNLLAVKNLRQVVAAIIQAKQIGKPVIFSLGGHVIKCGLGPIISDLIEQGIVTGIVLNGSGIIHDFEIALIGETSEDVRAALPLGEFGMAEETGRLINEAISKGVAKGWGMGKSICELIASLQPPYAAYSLLNTAHKHGVTVTVHPAIGADIIHQHPEADGAALGEAGFIDFKLLTSQIAGLGGGGVFANFGSAVIIPEVFLKALNLARNLGYKVTNFTTVNFDMIRHYRPSENIVKRPTTDGSRGYYLIGHHELMIPLLSRAIVEANRLC